MAKQLILGSEVKWKLVMVTAVTTLPCYPLGVVYLIAPNKYLFYLFLCVIAAASTAGIGSALFVRRQLLTQMKRASLFTGMSVKLMMLRFKQLGPMGYPELAQKIVISSEIPDAMTLAFMLEKGSLFNATKPLVFFSIIMIITRYCQGFWLSGN